MKVKKTHRLSGEQQKNLLLEMIRTDFKLRYQSSMLGYVWSILKPLFLFAIMYTVFSKFLRIGEGVPNYAISLLLGIVLWNFFVDATTGGLKSIVAKGSLIRKIDIPRHLIPIASVASAFINMLINLTVFFIFLAFTDQNAISAITFVVFPLLLVQLVVLTLGVTFFLSAVYVNLRDIDYIWDVLKQALFYAVPIIYPLSKITSEAFQKLIVLNPVAEIIQYARSVLTYSETSTLGDVYGNQAYGLLSIVITFVVFVFGYYYFKRRSPYFAEKV